MTNFTTEQGANYEIAHELLNRRIGTVNSQLATEEAKADPQANTLAALNEERRKYVIERDELRPENTMAVLDVLSRYQRRPTA